MNWSQIAAESTAFIAVSTGLAFVIRAIVREEMTKLDERFLPTKVADQKFQEIEKHFDFLRDQRSEDLQAARHRA